MRTTLFALVLLAVVGLVASGAWAGSQSATKSSPKIAAVKATGSQPAATPVSTSDKPKAATPAHHKVVQHHKRKASAPKTPAPLATPGAPAPSPSSPK